MLKKVPEDSTTCPCNSTSVKGYWYRRQVIEDNQYSQKVCVGCHGGLRGENGETAVVCASRVVTTTWMERIVPSLVYICAGLLL